MARPPLFTDQQIIAIGEKLRAKGPATATLLWEACGRRGRLNRYQTIWNRHEAEQRHAAAEGPSAGVVITLPEKAQCLATALKADLSAGIDRVTSSIYLATEDAQRGRFLSSDIRNPSVDDTENPATSATVMPRRMPVRVLP